MGLPVQPPSSNGRSPRRGRHPGHGPFGDRAFRVALGVCIVLVVVGLAMMLGGDGAAADVGTAFVVLCGVCLVVAGGLLAAERAVLRRKGR